MRLILFVAIVIGSCSVGFAAKVEGEQVYPDAYLTCKADSDCVVVQGTCAEWDCVNQKVSANVAEMNKKLAKEYGCAQSPPTPLPKPKVQCVAGKCKCTKPAASPPAAPKSGW